MTAERKAELRERKFVSPFDIDELLDALDAAEAEIERLRAKLETAPHSPDCAKAEVWRMGPCDCWKAKITSDHCKLYDYNINAQNRF